MKTIAFFATAALAKVTVVDRLHTEEEYWAGWSHFLSDVVEGVERFTDKAEHDMRFNIFKDNLDQIKTHNDGDHTWSMGITQFADMTREEFEAFLARSGSQMERHNADHDLFDPSGYGSNPNAVDWVAKGAVTPVKDQGQCGSCWAFSTTGCLEGQNFMVNGVLSSFSEQELVDCSTGDGNNGCNGGLMDYGFKFVKESGICMESDYSYDGADGTCKSSRCTPAIAAGKVTSWTDVAQGDEDALETAVANVGPIAIAVDANFKWQMYSGGIMSASLCPANKLDHGVLMVGYDTSGGYWKIKNSWASTWGENGYLRIVKGSNACGLANSASYPTLTK